MWACFAVDTVLFGGLDGLEQVPKSSLAIRLPCDELQYLRLQGHPQHAPRRAAEGNLLQQIDRETGLLGYHMALLDIRKISKR